MPHYHPNNAPKITTIQGGPPEVKLKVFIAFLQYYGDEFAISFAAESKEDIPRSMLEYASYIFEDTPDTTVKLRAKPPMVIFRDGTGNIICRDNMDRPPAQFVQWLAQEWTRGI